MVILMFVGACAGSTGGGMKVSRFIILFKSIGKEIKLAAHPRLTHRISMNGRTVEHETVRSVSVFLMAYFAIFATALLVISLDGFDFTTNFTAVATTINNMGPGLAGVGPTKNFAEFSGLSKAVFSLVMLIGRLEIFPMLVLLSPRSIRK
jgi:trk system potassium uptake protein TrkH